MHAGACTSELHLTPKLLQLSVHHICSDTLESVACCTSDRAGAFRVTEEAAVLPSRTR